MFYAYGYDKESKVTRLAQWEQVYKTTGIKPEKLEEKPELPDKLQYLWSEYGEICRGCEMIGYREIDSYNQVSGNGLSPWEASLIIEIDMIRRKNG